jgi:hypothetical protein
MIDLIFIIGIVLLFSLFFGLLYFHAEKIYDLQHNLKNMDNVYFKLFGSGSKYIDDREKWIKNYKRYMLLMAFLIACIAASVFIGVN